MSVINSAQCQTGSGHGGNIKIDVCCSRSLSLLYSYYETVFWLAVRSRNFLKECACLGSPGLWEFLPAQRHFILFVSKLEIMLSYYIAT